jgi:thiol:disulfide interchange protein
MSRHFSRISHSNLHSLGRCIVISCLFMAFPLATATTARPDGEVPAIKGFDTLPGFGAGNTATPKLALRARWYAASEPGTGWIEIEASLPKGWDHIYAITQPPRGPIATQIEVAAATDFEVVGQFTADPEPEVINSGIFPVPEYEHKGKVTWRAPLRLLAGAEPRSVEVRGMISGQICREGECAPMEPEDHRFVAKFDANLQGPAIAAGPPRASDPSESANTTEGTAIPDPIENPLDSGEPSGETSVQTRTGWTSMQPASLLQAIGIGLLGGLILNLMPCVLPVIGLKILSFVQQSQGDRTQAFLLNLVYSLGILTVMMVLASLSVRFNLSWGEQFGIANFKIAMIVLVFAMALSFLGVWEIRVPGFLGGSTAAGLAAKEGVVGAFSKGVFATILATPCSGPLLGPLFGFTLDRPPYVTYTIFAAVAVGMAFPYLWIGAFPGLARWIPKPGAWMLTFKELMAFPLLGTVVFLFMALGRSELFAPTLSLCFGVWFSCWWIGRVPLTAPFRAHLTAWVGGIAVAGLIGFGSFHYLIPKHHIAWQSFSPEALEIAQREGKTVLVDFTADWCATCKLNSANAIDTQRVAKLVEELGVVPMLADWTDATSPQGKVIKQTLQSLGSRSIPYLVIYPGARPEQKILLPDLLTESQVLDALRSAGPSVATETASKRELGGLEESL